MAVKKMYVVLCLAAMTVASARDQAKCAFDGAAAADDALDASIYIWAASKRCSKQVAQQDKVMCAVDITSALGSINGIVNVILNAVNECGDLKHDPECGLAIGDFTKATLDLGSAVANIPNDCIKTLGADASYKDTDIGDCAIDLSTSVKSIFQAAFDLKHIKEDCEDEQQCAQNSLDVVSAVNNIGGGLSSGVNDCQAFGTGAGNENAGCAGTVLSAVAAVADVAKAAGGLAQACPAKAARLYAAHKVSEADGNASKMVLVALLPVAAVVSFVAGIAGGLRLAKSRQMRSLPTAEETDPE